MGLVLLAVGASAQSAQSDVSATAVAEGETVTYTVTLRGGRGDRISAPLATGALELVSRSPILDATTITNGETTRQLAWAYRARRNGTGRIRPFRARINGQSVTAPGATVAVTASASRPQRRPAPSGVGRDALFVRAEPSRRTAYVGQQVVVDYVLYFEPEIQPRQTAPIGTWDAAGAWREEMDVPTAYPRPATINGRPYEAVTIRRVALFPTRDGTLELAPMQFTIDLVRITGGGRSSDPFAPFFSPFSQRFEDREVVAPSTSVEVRPLPPGAPAAFAGAVGDFSMTTTVDDRRVQAGDPVRVQVAIRGTGNTALLEPPALEVPSGVDAYDPAQDREAFRSAEPLRGIKTFAYTFVPQGGGTFEIPPAPFVYFDPADGRYKTLETDPVEVVVEGDALADAAPALGPDAPAGLKASADWQRPRGRATWLWGVLGGGLALPLVAAGLFLGVRRGRERLEADTPARRRRRARSVARRRLESARERPPRQAAAETERALEAYLADRSGVAAGPASAADVPDGLRSDLEAVLSDLERAQFAPGLGPDVGAVIDRADALVAALEARSERSPRNA